MNDAFFPAPPLLAPFVRGVWMLQGHGTGRADPVFPDGCPEVVFNLGDRVAGGSTASDTVTHYQAQAVGQLERPLFLQTFGRVDLVGLRLEPWGTGLLFPGRQGKTNRFVDAGQLFGVAACSTLLDKLASLADPERRARLLFGEVARILRPRATRAVQSLATVDSLPIGATVDDWARRAELSPRQLARHANEWIGLSPKLFLRMRRFQSMLRLLNADPARGLSRSALEVGYYDQSHVSRDFLQFAGAPPSRVLRTVGALTEAMLHDAEPTERTTPHRA